MHDLKEGKNNMNSDTKKRLQEILESEESCENFAKQIGESIFTQDEEPERAGLWIIKALLENDADALLEAICGWKAEYVINFMEHPE